MDASRHQQVLGSLTVGSAVSSEASKCTDTTKVKAATPIHMSVFHTLLILISLFSVIVLLFSFPDSFSSSMLPDCMCSIPALNVFNLDSKVSLGGSINKMYY